MRRIALLLLGTILIVPAGHSAFAGSTPLPFESLDKTSAASSQAQSTTKSQLPLPPLSTPSVPVPVGHAKQVTTHRDIGTGFASPGGEQSGNVRVFPGTASVVPQTHRKKAALPPAQTPKKAAFQPAPINLGYGLNRPLPVTGKTLPALGSLPKAHHPSRPYLLNLVDGENMAVYVSQSMPNRIATPFRKPEVIDSSGAKIQIVKGDIYVLPASSQPFGIYISDKSVARSPVISLTLVPKAIVGQSVIVQIDGVSQADTARAESRQTASNYTDEIKNLFRQVIRNVTPEGFTVDALPARPARRGNVEIIPQRRYSGQSMDIYVYRLINKGASPVTLSETSFYDKSVRAVSFFPNIRLNSNGSTRVFILAWKG